MNRKNEVIKDARVLTADYLPNKMVHRNGERKEISRCLNPILEDEQPLNMLVHGPPGTGKTAMSEYVVKQLKKNTFVNFSYVNCFGQPSKFEVFYELLDKKAQIPRDGTSTGKVIEKFEEKVRNTPTVIVIDEVDQVSNDEILFELSRFKSAGLMMISNNPNLLANFDDRVRSRFSGLNRIRFKRYDENELFDILKLRCKHGLHQGSIEDSLLKRIATSAGGDARIAINSLKMAAQKAENLGKAKITSKTVNESITDAQDENKSESLEKLNRHQRAIYDILQAEGDIASGELFERYRTEVEDDKSRRTFRRYMNKMDAYGLVDIKGKKKGRKFKLAE